MSGDECINGNQHGEILTRADNFDEYDIAVLGPMPDDHGWGYCRVCRAGFRWSVLDQRWRPFPGQVGPLPMLTEEELEVLHMAIDLLRQTTGLPLRQVRAESLRNAIEHRLSLLQSLDTAVLEARHGLQ